MSRLHYCLNGNSVTDQILLYQKSKSPADYLPIQNYYNEYKDHWYAQIEDYIDRVSFESEFDFKLCRAVDSFKIETADSIAAAKGYARLGAFNGWFYKILANWKSNVKTSSFRLKKRSPVQCPICGRFVGRIDSEHLQHHKSISDLPRFFVYDNEIFETSAVPRVNAVSWGEKTPEKWKDLQKGQTKLYTKKRVDWPWKLADGSKGVMCPFTKKVINQITVEYLQTLSEKHGRYAPVTSWESFVEKYPSSLIQSEMYSLDRAVFNGRDEKVFLKDHIVRAPKQSTGFDYNQMCSGVVPVQFEHTFILIDKFVKNETDRKILKLTAVGYSVEDISDTLVMDKKDVRNRIKSVKTNRDLETFLVG